jgi:hypothetical protein
MRSFLVSCFAVSVFATIPGVSLAGHDRPFKGSLESVVTVAPELDEFGILRLEGVINGQATIAGKITGSFVYYVNTNDGSFVGDLTKVAANRDEIYESFVGQFISATASIGQFTIEGGTGRFSNATGGGDFTGDVLVPFAVIDVGFNGTISGPK